jgi:hypothetical protein
MASEEEQYKQTVVSLNFNNCTRRLCSCICVLQEVRGCNLKLKYSHLQGIYHCLLSHVN